MIQSTTNLNDKLDAYAQTLLSQCHAKLYRINQAIEILDGLPDIEEQRKSLIEKRGQYQTKLDRLSEKVTYFIGNFENLMRKTDYENRCDIRDGLSGRIRRISEGEYVKETFPKLYEIAMKNGKSTRHPLYRQIKKGQREIYKFCEDMTPDAAKEFIKNTKNVFGKGKIECRIIDIISELSPVTFDEVSKYFPPNKYHRMRRALQRLSKSGFIKIIYRRWEKVEIPEKQIAESDEMTSAPGM